MQGRTLLMLALLAIPAGLSPARAEDEPPAPVPSKDADRDRAAALSRQAQAHWRAGEYAAAISRMERAVTISERLAGESEETARLTSRLGGMYLDTARLERALATNEAALGMHRRLHSGDHTTVALALGQLARTLSALGRPAASVRLRDEALDMERRLFPGDSDAVAETLSELGAALCQSGRVAEALPRMEEGLAMRRRLHPGDVPVVLVGLNNLAAVLHQLDRHSEALGPASEALEMAQRLYAQDHPDIALSLNSLGAVLYDLGRPDDALPFLEEAVVRYRRLHPRGDVALASALRNLGEALTDLDRAETAVPFLEEAVAMQRRLLPDDHPHLLGTYLGLTKALHAVGDAAKEIEFAEKAIRILDRHPRKSGSLKADLRSGLALALHQVGRTPEALPLLQQAVAMRRSTLPIETERLAVELGNVAAVLTTLGRPAEAVELERESLAMLRRIHPGDHPAVSDVLDNLAAALSSNARSDEALPFIEEALAMSRRLHRGDHHVKAGRLNDYGCVLRALRRPAEALEVMEEARAMYGRLQEEEDPAIASIHTNLGTVLSDLGRRTEAIDNYRTAAEVAVRTSWPRRHIALTLLGEALLGAGRPEEALEPLRDAIACLEGLRSNAGGLRSAERAAYLDGMRGHWDPYANMVRAQVALGRETAALAFLEQGRGREMLDLLERGRFDPIDEVRSQAEAAGNEQALVEIDAAHRGVEEARSRVVRCDRVEVHARATGIRSEIRAAVLAASGARRVLLDALARQHRLVEAALPETTPLPPDEIQALLAPDDRLLAYAVGQHASFVFLVSPAAIRAVPLRDRRGPLRAVRVDRLVRERVKVLSDRDADIPLDGTLFRTLVPPDVWNEVRAAKRLYVMGHHALHEMPFEALVTGVQDGVPVYWLDTGPPIAYIASASVLAWLRNRRDARDTSSETMSLVALGDPVFSRRGLPPRPREMGAQGTARGRVLQPLPGTRDEVEAIRAVLLAPDEPRAHVQTLLGREATEARLFQAVEGKRLVHVATHGIVDESESASFSYVALTRPATPVPGDDGALTLNDLLTTWRGRLAGTDLVVLSACDTQKGRLRGDEGVFALPWGFHFAGSPTVVASLWRVSDGSTPVLMETFYRRLVQDQEGGPLLALQAARRAMRTTHPHPYFWAPFVMLGDPR